MATEKQIAANRRNAQKSTGPKTPEGKARSSRNRLSHGLFAEDVVVAEVGETEQDFLAHLQSFRDSLSPDGPVEDMLVRDIATADWRIQRVVRMETGALRDGVLHLESLEAEFPIRPARFEAFEENELRNKDGNLLGCAFLSSIDRMNKLSLYQSRLERGRDRALDRLQKLQRDRRLAQQPAPQPAVARPAPVVAAAAQASARPVHQSRRFEPNSPPIPFKRLLVPEPQGAVSSAASPPAGAKMTRR